MLRDPIWSWEHVLRIDHKGRNAPAKCRCPVTLKWAGDVTATGSIQQFSKARGKMPRTFLSFYSCNVNIYILNL